MHVNISNNWFIESTNTVDFSKCSPNTWSDIASIKTVADHVKKADAVILPSGELLKRRDWKTGYEDCLSWSCENNKKTEIVMKAYEEAFNYPESLKKDDIRQFIKNNVHLFGVNKYTFD
ncbi:MAG: hypothetical protein JSR46_09800, partial [Verrucomicrobia bacterium]|nr:hypothetical protein [Verrucomicrobiota bacterium]